MAGHNKWSKVKRYKEAADKKKGAVWSKILKEIMVAAKNGSDPSANARLRKAITDAKAASVPKDNIERAIKKGAGELEGGTLDELVYEGYGPHGVAILVECVTDNRLRTQPEIRKIFEKHNGNLAEIGAVSWGFTKMGVILIPKDAADENALMDLVLNAGAEDMHTSDDGYEIHTPTSSFDNVREALEKANIPTALAEVTNVPSNKISISGDASTQIQNLIEALEDHDDVQRVSSNADFG